MKTIFKILIPVMIAMVSCQKLDTPELDSSNTINGFKCYVYYDSDDWTVKEEVDVLSGTYNESLGAISYTFPSDESIYNQESLSRCRLEVSIPSTATLEETDATGAVLGNGIGGQRNLCNTTVYFRVTAADGSYKAYQATFRYSGNN